MQHSNVIVVVIRMRTCLTHELASEAPEGKNNLKHEAN